MPNLAKVTQLYETNYRDAAATLRCIADGIEAGKYGDVGCVAISLLGDSLEVFAAGPDSDAPSAGMVLHAGFMKLSRSLLEHGE